MSARHTFAQIVLTCLGHCVVRTEAVGGCYHHHEGIVVVLERRAQQLRCEGKGRKDGQRGYEDLSTDLYH